MTNPQTENAALKAALAKVIHLIEGLHCCCDAIYGGYLAQGMRCSHCNLKAELKALSIQCHTPT